MTSIPSRATGLLPIAVLFFGLNPLGPSGVCQAAPGEPAATTPPASSSRIGLVGLIREPSADLTPDGRIGIWFFGQFAPRGAARSGDQNGFATTIGFLPRLELGVALNEYSQANPGDITACGKLQLVQETRLWPAVSAGVFGLKGGGIPSTRFIAASKRLIGNRLNTTLGYLNGGSTGAYGGMELGILPHLSGVLEYDSRDLNYGARVSFFHDYAQVAAVHLIQGWALQFGGHVPLSTVDRVPARAALPQVAIPTGKTALQAIQDQLRSLGLENISAAILEAPERCLQVAYENRSFPHNEMNALSNVLAAAAAYAPDGVTCISAIIKREDLPVLRVMCPLAEYREFMAGRMSQQDFARHFSAAYTAEAPDVRQASSQASPRMASSYGRTDIFLNPGVVTEFASENYVFAVAASVIPEIELPVWRGVGITSSFSVPLTGPLAVRSRAPFLNSLVNNPRIRLQELSAHWTWRPRDFFAARIYGGQFPGSKQGVYSEAVWVPGDGRFLVRATAGTLEQIQTKDSSGTYILEGRYYIPQLDLELVASEGQFLDADNGTALLMQRRFGNTEFNFEYRNTSTGKVILMGFSVPLGDLRLGRRPQLVRIRPPDFFTFCQRSLLTAPNYISSASATGNQLSPIANLTRTFLDRDKIVPAYIMRSLAELRRIDRLTP